ncbi:MAG: ribonuclease HII [Candidatus Moranbacteria bacterium]|jgi:ribonuclease HII|nr:ribonuclease HII [Candidatus Moranbacteria bacterium]
MEIATFDLEKELLGKGYGFVIGVDEAGRGPLAGPVVACAATLKNNESGIKNQELKEWDLVRDSKKLSAGQREKAFDFVLENFHVGIGICDHETIDRINILEASFLAMKKALTNLIKSSNFQFSISNFQSISNNQISNDLKNEKQLLKYIILVDGNKKIPNFSGEQLAVVGGDKIVKSISAASIIAKVTRDRMMLEAHKKYPEYHFDKHKGYGTKIHMESLKQYGPCEIHRKSFAPVKMALK